MKKIVIIDFGGQYTHLIARRIRNLGVFSEIFQPEEFAVSNDLIGIIFSGGPQSVNAEDAYRINIDIRKINLPILGICYGHQILATMLDGTIEIGESKEYGSTSITCQPDSVLFAGLEFQQVVWMSHRDHVSELPSDCRITASSSSIDIASFESNNKRFFGMQFHPEVTHTANGLKMLDRFINVCTDHRDWKAENFKVKIIQQIRDEAKGRRLVLLLSGGVDSLVALQLCIQAVGNENVFSIHVDTGFMRKNESSEIMKHFAEHHFENIKIIKAEKTFIKELQGVVEPEIKRLTIGKLFVEIANNEVKVLEKDEELMLVQGTIYPDTIESGSSSKAAKIKTHHNRVDEITKLISAGRVIEPIKDLYKDEVRKLGEELGLPEKLVHRQPFPGPGLAIRIICSNTKRFSQNHLNENVRLNEILSEFGLQGEILPVKSVGVQGDFRTYHHPAVVWSKSGIEPDWKSLTNSASKAINNLQSVNRIVFSIKPVKLHLGELFLEIEVIDKLREVDALIRQETDHIAEIWQMPVVALPLFEAGKQAYVMRPVCSTDAMTASVFELDFAEIKRLDKIIQKIKGVGSLLYDITTKPPGTIEWE
ncbi:MAG: glutamine-hydrolyzing GMP synthase [Candidatus Cloacimonetes bacterium]|nr:glutamine-hydrolyzing GMP synthase [Candidatus Cloacimonadota bacterium]